MGISGPTPSLEMLICALSLHLVGAGDCVHSGDGVTHARPLD